MRKFSIRKYASRTLSALALLPVFLAACSDENGGANGSRVRNLISRELKVGASQGDIEAFFGKYNVSYVRDEGRQKYYAILRGPSKFRAVSITVFFDFNGKFLHAEVHDSYAGL